ncbi:MAG: hypothetical protein DRP55_10475 [Spirochaetes bacterium]|nr:MAG: hypothetical protein DRP55_10475 [Spirochaetota bacterium]
MRPKIPYTPPSFQKEAFNCPYCNVYARQLWHFVRRYDGYSIEDLMVCYCSYCGEYSIWYKEKMIYPDCTGIEPPNQDLDEEIKNDYTEAASILQKSPRGACALLRLAIQKLCIKLGEEGKNLNEDIANLVKKGLPVKIQKALDAVRVIGNEAVHPGELDLKDDIVTATQLFKLINFIAEKMITEPKEVEEIYNKIPESKKKQIEERDKDG